MKRKLVSTICMITIAITSLAGCGKNPDDPFSGMSKKEVIEQYNMLQDQYIQLGTDFDNLKRLNAGIQSETEVTAAIDITGDGTGRFSFNSVDSKIIFPVSFIYPNATTLPGDGSVSIVNDVIITPTSNWICKLNGTTLELENTDSGISGTIKIGKQNYIYTSQELKDQVLDQWFAELPPSTVNYTDIAVAGQSYGMQATTPTTIDHEDAYLRCGMFATGNSYCVTYVFVYRGNSDATKNESITNLLNSMSVAGSKIIVQMD